eukprot:228371_1
MAKCVICFLCLLLHFNVHYGFQCLNADGSAAVNDWWFIYKLAQNTFDYLYWDEDPAAGDIPAIQNLLNEQPSALSRTILQHNEDQFIFMAYNDQRDAIQFENEHPHLPNQKIANIGPGCHCKGMFAIDFSADNNPTGYWIIHSQPQFPSIHYDDNPDADNIVARIFQHAVSNNAQHYFCFTIEGNAQWIRALNQLIAMNARFYVRKCGALIDPDEDMGIGLAIILQRAYMCGSYDHDHHHWGIQQNEEPNQFIANQVSSQSINDRFTHFAAGLNAQHQNNIFVHIAHYPQYGCSFLWQTWGMQLDKSDCHNDACRSHPNCNQEACENDSTYIHIPNNIIRLPDGTHWTINQDHAKIGLTFTAYLNNKVGGDDYYNYKWKYVHTGANKVVCFGDLNRANIQLQSGGGFVCTTQLPGIHASLSKMFTIQRCVTAVRDSAKEKYCEIPFKRKRKRAQSPRQQRLGRSASKEMITSMSYVY